MNPDEFIALLRCLIVADNVQRNAAEQHFVKLRSENPSQTLLYLAEVVRHPQIDGYLKHLAIVLFRRAVLGKEENCWHLLSVESKRTILGSIEASLKELQDHNLRLKVAEIAGEVAGSCLEPQDWPELQQLTVALNQSAKPEDRVIGLTLLGQISFILTNLDDQFLISSAHVLKQSFELFLGHGDGSLAVAGSLNYILQSIQRPSQWESLRPLIPSLFISLGRLLSLFESALTDAEKTTYARYLSSYLEHVVDMVDHSAEFFQSHLEIFVPSIFPYLRATSPLPTALKQPLLEILVLLSEKVSKKVRKLQGPKNKKSYFLSEILKVCEAHLLKIRDQAKWESLDTIEELESNSQSAYEIGESAFRRCMTGLGVVHTYKKVSQTLTTLFTQGAQSLSTQPALAWKQIIAALTMLAAYVEITVNIEDSAQLAVHRHEVYSTLQQFLLFPPHPALPSVAVARIRNAAYQALSAFLLFHGSALNEEQCGALLSTLLPQVDASVNPAPRLRRSILIALIHVLENIGQTTLLQEVAMPLLTTLCTALQPASQSGGAVSSSSIVQESAIAALVTYMALTKHHAPSSSSSSSKSASSSSWSLETWRNVYTHLMPLLKQLLHTYQQRGQESLWAQTLECITLLGEVVGAAEFYPDAQELLQFIVQMQSVVQPHSDVDLALLKATARVARCLGQEFAPHLHGTVVRIFSALTLDVIVSDRDLKDDGHEKERDIDLDDDEDDGEGDDDEGDDEDGGVQMLETLEGHWVPVRTSMIEAQIEAIQMLTLLLRTPEQQAAYFPYLQQTLEFLPRTLMNSPHEDVRAGILALCPALALVPWHHYQQQTSSTTVASTEAYTAVQQVLVYLLGLLLPYLEKETSDDLIMTGLETLRALIQCTADPTGGSTSLLVLEEGQLAAILQTIKMVVRDSVQRRAILRANRQMEAQEEEEKQSSRRRQPGGGRSSDSNSVFRTAPPDSDEEDGEGGEGGRDEEDEDREVDSLFRQTLELHYHLAEVLGALLKTHGVRFVQTLTQHDGWNMIISLSHAYCLVEDRRFSFLVLCDALEHGLSAQSATSAPITTVDEAALVSQTLSIFGDAIVEMSALLPTYPLGQKLRPSFTSMPDKHSVVDWEVLRCAVYGLGAVYRRRLLPGVGAVSAVQTVLDSARGQCLVALQRTIAALLQVQAKAAAMPHAAEDLSAIGAALDNAVRSLGVIVHVSLVQDVHTPVLSAAEKDEACSLLLRYLGYLPLHHDTEEGEKALQDLVGMLTPADWRGAVPTMMIPAFYDFVRGGDSSAGEKLIAALVPLAKALHEASSLSLSAVTIEAIAELLFQLLQGSRRVDDAHHLLPRLMVALGGTGSELSTSLVQVMQQAAARFQS